VRRLLPELRRNLVTSSHIVVKSVEALPTTSTSRTSGASKVETAKKPVSKPTLL